MNLAILLNPLVPGTFSLPPYSFTNRPILVIPHEPGTKIRLHDQAAQCPELKTLLESGNRPLLHLEHGTGPHTLLHTALLNSAIDEAPWHPRPDAGHPRAGDGHTSAGVANPRAAGPRSVPQTTRIQNPGLEIGDDDEDDEWETEAVDVGDGEEDDDDAFLGLALDFEIENGVVDRRSGGANGRSGLRNTENAVFSADLGAGVKHLTKPVPAPYSSPTSGPKSPKLTSIPRIYNGKNTVLRSLEGLPLALEISEQEQRVLDAERRADEAESRSLALESVLACVEDVRGNGNGMGTTIGMPVANTEFHNPFADLDRAPTPTHAPSADDRDLFGGRPNYTPVGHEVPKTRSTQGPVDPFADYVDVVLADGSASSELVIDDVPRNKGGRPRDPLNRSRAQQQRDSARNRYHADKLNGVGHAHRKAPELESDRQEISDQELKELERAAQKKAAKPVPTTKTKKRPKALKTPTADALALVDAAVAELERVNEERAGAGRRRISKARALEKVGKKVGVVIARDSTRAITDPRALAIARARRADPKMVREADEQRRATRVQNEMMGVRGKRRPPRTVDSEYML